MRLHTQGVRYLRGHQQDVHSIDIRGFLRDFVVITFGFHFGFVFILVLIRFIRRTLRFSLHQANRFVPGRSFHTLKDEGIHQVYHGHRSKGYDTRYRYGLFSLRCLATPSLVPSLGSFYPVGGAVDIKVAAVTTLT